MSPSTAAAPRARVVAQSRFEVGTLLRNGEQLLVSLVLPAIVLVALSVTSVPSLGAGRRIDLAVPGVLALCVISASFTAQGIATAFDRRYSVLRYLGVTPLGRGGLIAGKVIATLVVEAIQVVVLGGLGLALGWRPVVGGIGYAAVFLVLGTWAFVSLALLMAGTLRAEAVLALANLVWILFLALGGVIVPRSRLPGWAEGATGWLSSAGLADGLRAALAEGSFAWAGAAVLVAWGLVCTALAGRFFRWGD
ncbi:ABC transporter permease [Intrasporangium sp.]|uniref:ABC transporter permease n=1 Tax=Intrasporangium sp. TaxID=1925024 RepID=UPI003221577D